MDGTRFDAMTKALATGRSRRGVLKVLAGAAVALGATAVGAPSLRAQTCVGDGEDCTVDDDCCGRQTCGEDGTCGGPTAGCVAAGEDCANESCCQGFYCNDAGVCSAAAECASEGGGCDADEACCGDMICNEDRRCEAATTVAECAVDGDCAGAGEICCGGVCAAIECCTDDADPNARCAEGTACFEGYCDPVGSETDGTTELPNTGIGDGGGGVTGLLGAGILAGTAAYLAGKVLRSDPPAPTA
jgi:hypothetical protein